jgi:hypothetical protein
MGRFFFDLQGKHHAIDPTGLPFDTELDAFRAAQRLAAVRAPQSVSSS